MDVRFHGKKALVTGAGRGIGRALVKKLVECGAEVYALSYTQANLDSLKEELSSVHIVQVDLADWDATRKAVEGMGYLDCVVNNASFYPSPLPFVDASRNLFEEVLNINLMAAVNVGQVAARGMLASGNGGAIVNISSVNSSIVMNQTAPYHISKAALDMLTKCMAMELGPAVRVNAVNPTLCARVIGNDPWSDPEIVDLWRARHSMKRFAEDEEVVNTILFLLSDKATYITGTCIPVDGGLLSN